MKHESMNIRRVIRANRLLAEQGHANDTLAALNEMAELRKDAERYRWLRDHTTATGLSRFVRWNRVQFLDEAVDRSMAADAAADAAVGAA